MRRDLASEGVGTLLSKLAKSLSRQSIERQNLSGHFIIISFNYDIENYGRHPQLTLFLHHIRSQQLRTQNENPHK